MSIQTALAIVLTVLPIMVLLRYFYTRDICREPRTALVKTFLLGLLVTIPAIPLSLGLSAILLLFSPGPLLAALYDAFVVAAVPEELLKLLVIALYCARRVSFDEPMDGVVYGATAALGFAALENVLYVVDGGWAVALVRSVTAVSRCTPSWVRSSATMSRGLASEAAGVSIPGRVWESQYSCTDSTTSVRWPFPAWRRRRHRPQAWAPSFWDSSSCSWAL